MYIPSGYYGACPWNILNLQKVFDTTEKLWRLVATTRSYFIANFPGDGEFDMTEKRKASNCRIPVTNRRVYAAPPTKLMVNNTLLPVG